MEPREQVLEQTREPRPEEKKGRFRIVKLEERIAPYTRIGWVDRNNYSKFNNWFKLHH
jgi:hypothetical protein